MQSTQDTVTFMNEPEEVRDYDSFLVSFDVSSLFTNIPLNETIELILDYILSNNLDINISKKDLKVFFVRKLNFLPLLKPLKMNSSEFS